MTGVAEPALREDVRLLAEADQDLILTARGAEQHAHGVARFTSFVNAPDVPDPSNAFVQERGQVRPARPDEKGPTLVAGPVLEVVRA